MIGSPELVVAIETAVSAAAGAFHIENVVPAPGGCIHRSYILKGGRQKFFAKINDSSQSDNFAAEADGLTALATAGARVPSPLCQGGTGKEAFLILEYLELAPEGDYPALGRTLAALHSLRQEEEYGWRRNNYIGKSRQPNLRSRNWGGFWKQMRLAPQLELAKANHLGVTLLEKGERLAVAVPRLLAGHAPKAALLHGDLWRGNAGFLSDGTPVLFDPAVYCGDREADLAMTELFGGYPQAFY